MFGYIDAGTESYVVQIIVGLLVGGGIALALAFIPASIAAKKGRSRGLWVLYGLFLFLPALIHALLIPDESGRRCPHCAEYVKPEAVVCKHCGRDLTPAAQT